jgi:hypothetical protein
LPGLAREGAVKSRMTASSRSSLPSLARHLADTTYATAGGTRRARFPPPAGDIAARAGCPPAVRAGGVIRRILVIDGDPAVPALTPGTNGAFASPQIGTTRATTSFTLANGS